MFIEINEPSVDPALISRLTFGQPTHLKMGLQQKGSFAESAYLMQSFPQRCQGDIM